MPLVRRGLDTFGRVAEAAMAPIQIRGPGRFGHQERWLRCVRGIDVMRVRDGRCARASPSSRAGPALPPHQMKDAVELTVRVAAGGFEFNCGGRRQLLSVGLGPARLR